MRAKQNGYFDQNVQVLNDKTLHKIKHFPF